VTVNGNVPRPQPAAGDPHTGGPGAATVSTAEPPKCPTRTRAYRDGEVVAEGFPAENIREVLDRDDSCVVWLDLFDPDEADLKIVTHEFGLHPLAVEDAVHDHQRPKVDRYDTHLFVNAYAVEVQEDPLRLKSSEISMFVTRRALVTVRKSEFDVDTLIRRWDVGEGIDRAAGVGFLLYGVLDAIGDGHYEAIERLEDLAEDLEDHLFEPSKDFDIRRRGFEIRRTLAALRRVVEPMHDVLSRLIRSDLHLVTAELAPYYEDIDDHAQRTRESVDSARDLVASVLEAKLTEQSNQLNEITKKLASWAAIIAVPTAITGFYGQNVPYPGFGTHGGFVASVVVIVVLATGVYALLRSRNWL
jgi:magnesium transporter